MSTGSPPVSTCCSATDVAKSSHPLDPVVAPSAHPEWGSNITTRWNEEGGMYWIEEEMKSKLSLVPLTDQAALETIALLGRRLLEMDVHQLERAVYRLGTDRCREFLAITEKKIQENAPEDALFLYTQDGSNRARTPGGVFWKIIKTSKGVNPEDKSFIYRGNTTRQNKIRRDKARIDLIFTNLNSFAPTDPRVRAIRDIVASLGMTETTIAERLIEKKGVDFARALLAQSLELYSDASKDPSQVGENILRKKASVEIGDAEDVQVKRTPGGVFAQLIKADENISIEDKSYIFALSRGGKTVTNRHRRGRGRPAMFTKQYQDASWKACGGVGTPGRFIGDMDYQQRGDALPASIPPPEGNMAGFMILPEGA
ncbi:hypothetical protein FOL47_003251 [Perkinsus chesapeaki]|uniref:Phosphorylated adapter RNA export protein n=1 Tax=Perkinsus chesapeaki TaxID=330153 RepID=A0A7J6N2R1_PERCH|nr:hypothetical protein FOL47_003251 [Perkinsus chesapeaki]